MDTGTCACIVAGSRAMSQAQPMTATPHEVQVFSELLAFLDENGLRYELLDGCVVVTPPATFGNERLDIAIAATPGMPRRKMWRCSAPTSAITTTTCPS